MDIDPKFASDLKKALTSAGVLELPWLDIEFPQLFWRAVNGLTIDQAVAVARVAHRAVEFGNASGRATTTA